MPSFWKKHFYLKVWKKSQKFSGGVTSAITLLKVNFKAFVWVSKKEKREAKGNVKSNDGVANLWSFMQ